MRGHAAVPTASSLWFGTLSNRENHRQSFASEYLPCLTAAVAWVKAASVLKLEPFSPSLLQVYHTLIHMGIMPDTAITNSAISACDKGEAGTKSEQHRWRSAEVDSPATFLDHLGPTMWDDHPCPAEVNFTALIRINPSGCRRPVAVSSGHLQLHDRAGPEAGRHHLFQPHQCPGQGQAVGDCS